MLLVFILHSHPQQQNLHNSPDTGAQIVASLFCGCNLATQMQTQCTSMASIVTCGFKRSWGRIGSTSTSCYATKPYSDYQHAAQLGMKTIPLSPELLTTCLQSCCLLGTSGLSLTGCERLLEQQDVTYGPEKRITNIILKSACGIWHWPAHTLYLKCGCQSGSKQAPVM